ncbi:MAG: hypothetical protein WCK81_02855 [Betaproteobacteria bacterium]
MALAVTFRRSMYLGTCALGLVCVPPAHAYKVERVCEMSEATLNKPAKKVCKTLLVKPKAEGEADKKDEKKEEKPAAGHH